MIKINLLKNMGSGFVRQQSVAGIQYGEVKSTNKNLVYVKILLIILIPYSVKMFESHVVEENFSVLQEVQKRFNQVRDEESKLGLVYEEVKSFEETRSDLQKRINVIQSMAKDRLVEVVALDKLQQFIKERTWLKELEITNREISMKGFYISEKDLDEFIQGLEKSVFFSDIKLQTSNEKKSQVNSNARSFQLNCKIVSI